MLKEALHARLVPLMLLLVLPGIEVVPKYLLILAWWILFAIKFIILLIRIW